MSNTPTTPTPPAHTPGEHPYSDSPDIIGFAPHREGALTGNRAISIKRRDIEPPAALYILQDDLLTVNITSSLVITGANQVNITAQVLLPDGRIQQMVWAVYALAAYATQTLTFALCEGFLFNVSTQAVGATVSRGQTYISVQLKRGGSAGNILQTLISDYVDSYYSPTWPGGLTRSPSDGNGYPYTIIVSSPSAGANWFYRSPNFTRWAPQIVTAKLVTSSAAANRQVQFFVESITGASGQWNDMCEYSQPASTTVTYGWAVNWGSNQTAAQNGYLSRSMPTLYMGYETSIGVLTANIQSGDQWSAIGIYTQEWLDPA